jgi:hypothetical protein
MAGNWQINLASIANPGIKSLGGGFSLNQTGMSVSGIMHLLLPPCFNLIEDINLNGGVNGPTLQLTTSSVNGQTFSLTASGSETSLTGNYMTSGAACAPSDQGTFSAVLVPSATGTWQGTLTSATGAITQVTATLTQSGPDSHGFFSVSGTVTFNGSCLSSSSGTIIGSLVNGGTYVFTVSPSGLPVAGDVLIAVNLSDPAAGRALSGLYISNASACLDNGKASLSKQ